MNILWPSYKHAGSGNVLDYSAYTHKKCSMCKMVKPVSEFRIEKNVHSALGWHYRSACKPCARPYNNAWHARKRRLAGIPEKGPAPAEVRRERHRAARKKCYWKHIDRNRLRSKLWKLANPERRRFNEKTRRARKRNAGGSHTFAEWKTLCQMYGYLCPFCFRAEPEIKLTQDHIIPLSKGGGNGIDNIQPLCFSCNASKRDSTEYRYETDLMRFEPEESDVFGLAGMPWVPPEKRV